MKKSSKELSTPYSLFFKKKDKKKSTSLVLDEDFKSKKASKKFRLSRAESNEDNSTFLPIKPPLVLKEQTEPCDPLTKEKLMDWSAEKEKKQSPIFKNLQTSDWKNNLLEIADEENILFNEHKLNQTQQKPIEEKENRRDQEISFTKKNLVNISLTKRTIC